MSNQQMRAEAPDQAVEKQENRPEKQENGLIEDGELDQIAGGAAGEFTQEQYDKWEGQGPADRTDHGPGSGE